MSCIDVNVLEVQGVYEVRIIEKDSKTVLVLADTEEDAVEIAYQYHFSHGLDSFDYKDYYERTVGVRGLSQIELERLLEIGCTPHKRKLKGGTDANL